MHGPKSIVAPKALRVEGEPEESGSEGEDGVVLKTKKNVSLRRIK